MTSQGQSSVYEHGPDRRVTARHCFALDWYELRRADTALRPGQGVCTGTKARRHIPFWD